MEKWRIRSKSADNVATFLIWWQSHERRGAKWWRSTARQV